jgi:hypothetical protein
MRRQFISDRWLVIGFLICCGVGFVYFLVCKVHAYRLKCLLRGDTDVAIASLTINDRGSDIEITDPESIRYLNAAFRSAIHEGYVPKHQGGQSFYADISFGSIGSARTVFHPSDVEDGIIIGYPLGGWDDAQYYWIALPEPRPAAVTDALARMRHKGP